MPNPTPTSESQRERDLAISIISSLTSRAGFDSVWDDTDATTQQQVIAELERVGARYLQSAFTAGREAGRQEGIDYMAAALSGTIARLRSEGGGK